MRVFVWWLQAPVSDAGAIRSTIASEDRKRSEWPHVALPGVDGPDMNKLEKLARPKRPKGSAKIGGVLLDKSKLTATPFTAVSQMNPEYLQALTALDEAGLAALAAAWVKVIDRVEEKHALELVTQMAAFARQAAEKGSPVLELVAM